MIENLLMQLAFAMKRLSFTETESHHVLQASFCGMQITIAAVSKEELKKAEQARKRAQFSVVS